MPFCPLCRSDAIRHFVDVGVQTYWRCDTCQMTFLDPAQLPNRDVERAHYDSHENDPDDPGYRRFLSKVSGPVIDRTTQGACGIDFGCGPGPALIAVLREAGLDVVGYDPQYRPDASVLERKYDFVTCTEVVEHLHDPARTFSTLFGLLKPSGLLAVMTCFQTDDDRFASWHYRADPTHVCFYRAETMGWVAQHFGAELTIPIKDVALFQV